MRSDEFIQRLNDAYGRMLDNYPGGLSNTSISKFDEVRRLFQELLNIEDGDKIYAIGSGTRPGNIEVRLSQGIRAFLHTTLGLAFIKASSIQAAQKLSDSAVVTVTNFLTRGKATYDSVLILAELDGKAIPTRLISYPDSPVSEPLMQIFSGIEGFQVLQIERPPTATSQFESITSAIKTDIEFWKIPDDPIDSGERFPVQRLVEGCPGSGKSYRLEQDSKTADRIIRTVFHPETGYSDFVGFLSPETAFRIEEPSPVFSKALPGSPCVYYSFCCGPLLEAYVLAVLNPTHRVVLVIEELSRAPASLVFGDTLQLLDRVGVGEVDPTLPPLGFSRYEIRPRGEVKQLIESLEAFPPHTQPGHMRFPANLNIWATMNRADQNAKQLDTAFLRRWRREHISHDTIGTYDERPVSYLGGSKSWGDFRKLFNDILISSGAREDKLIGAYFLPESALGDTEQVADDLLAYVWHDVLREDGNEVFPGVKTFSELRARWISGTISIGSPDL